MILHVTHWFSSVEYRQFGRNYLIDRVLTVLICVSHTFTPPNGFLANGESRFSWSSDLFAAIPLQRRPRHGKSLQRLCGGLHQWNANLHAATRDHYGWCWYCGCMSHGKKAVYIFYAILSFWSKLNSRCYKIDRTSIPFTIKLILKIAQH